MGVVRCVAVLMLVAACGRIGFDPTASTDDGRPNDGTASDGATTDGMVDGGTDGPPAACLSNALYTSVVGLNHRYRDGGNNNQITWAAARDVCADDGASLVVFSSADEQMRIGSIRETWLGITDEATEGVWLTVDGAPIPHDGWGGVEPDGGTAQNCGRSVDTLNPTMESRDCTSQREWICECS